MAVVPARGHGSAHNLTPSGSTQVFVESFLGLVRAAFANLRGVRMTFSGLHVLQLALTAAYCKLVQPVHAPPGKVPRRGGQKAKGRGRSGGHFRFSLSVSSRDASAGFTLGSPDRRRCLVVTTLPPSVCIANMELIGKQLIQALIIITAAFYYTIHIALSTVSSIITTTWYPAQRFLNDPHKLINLGTDIPVNLAIKIDTCGVMK